MRTTEGLCHCPIETGRYDRYGHRRRGGCVEMSPQPSPLALDTAQAFTRITDAISATLQEMARHLRERR